MPRSWELYVDDQIKSLTGTTYADTDSTVSVLDDPPPRIRKKPPDSVVDITWRSSASLVPCLPRAIIHYEEGDEASTIVEGWAVVTILPASDSSGAGPADEGDRQALEEYQAEGLELLLKQIIIDEPLVVENDQVYDIAYTFASTFKHPAYDTVPANFTGNVADTLEIAFAPEMTMFDFLTMLTEQIPGYTFYIDSGGDLHFELA